MNDSEDGYYYRVSYDTVMKCNCPKCPSGWQHVTSHVFIASTPTVDEAVKNRNKAWEIDGAINVRIERREITEWEEFLI